jgi:prepilin-type N-terminal cleavage/methylation domain-containing protein
MQKRRLAPTMPSLRAEAGFSLLELLASLVIISLLMAGVFGFIYQAQKRFQGNVVVSESNQSARAALELMTQEIGQAGYNPPFYPHKTCAVSVPANADPQCITLNDITGINPGDWLSVDTGPYNEIVRVTGTSANGACGAANQIQAVFEWPHTPAGSPAVFPVASYKFPFATGILFGNGGSDDHNLYFFGDINSDGVIRYVVYSLSPTTTPATTVNIDGTTYTLYNLYRSATSVSFPGTTSPGTNTAASPVVQNVLYYIDSSNPANSRGPTGSPLFGYPSVFTVGIVPNQITVVGTVVLTISVAVNPKSLESGIVQWYTMATQIRPLNLAAAVAVNQSGGGKFMAKRPNDLPMTNPSNYYQ